MRPLSCISACGLLFLAAAVSSLAQTNLDPQLVSKADAGDLAAETELGQFFQAKQEYSKAATWYRKAADRGYAKAQVELGGLYQVGWGVPSKGAQRGQRTSALCTKEGME
jgi:TPR repeat protein